MGMWSVPLFVALQILVKICYGVAALNVIFLLLQYRL